MLCCLHINASLLLERQACRHCTLQWILSDVHCSYYDPFLNDKSGKRLNRRHRPGFDFVKAGVFQKEAEQQRLKVIFSRGRKVHSSRPLKMEPSDFSGAKDVSC